MSLSRKNYVAIAEIIRERRDAHLNITDEKQRFAARIAIARVARDLSRYFETDNDNFDPKRFLNACGLDNDESRG